jgi:hypothetical protein
MKNIYAILVLSFSFASLIASAQSGTLFDQLVSVNQEWTNQPDIDQRLKVMPAAVLTEHQLIQLHLQETEKLLRKRVVASPAALNNNRAHNLDVLHKYWQAGVFPTNTLHGNRQPYFIDDFGTYCAVGYLMQQGGGAEIAKRIHASQNYKFLADIDDRGLMNWVASSGLTFDELALIQPQYPEYWKCEVTELHYNNTGTDIGEYLEIAVDDGYGARKHLDSIFFYNQAGGIYKKLGIAQMQSLVVNNRPFVYYSFIAPDTLADAGRIELKGMLQGYLHVNADMQHIIYNGSGIEVRDFPPQCCPPNYTTTNYSIGENETTPLGSSLNFCTGSLQGLAATTGTLNPCIILPIQLSGFYSRINNKAVDLFWQTASENNTDKFIVERSNEGIDFQPLGSVKAAGNSVSLRTYSFNDKVPAYNNHYRIKQVDIDGKSTYSKILFVKVNAASSLHLVQNIINSDLQYQVTAAKGNVEVFDITGRKIYSTPAQGGTGHINTSSWCSGKYIIQMVAGDGQVYRDQFMKQ